MKKLPPCPPWLNDREPEKWVTAGVAANFYFRKSMATLKRYIKSGYLDELGMPTFWDGKRWHVRLPYLIKYKHGVHINRKVA